MGELSQDPYDRYCRLISPYLLGGGGDILYHSWNNITRVFDNDDNSKTLLFDDDYIRASKQSSLGQMFKGIASILCNKATDEPLDQWRVYKSTPTTQKLRNGDIVDIPAIQAFTWFYKQDSRNYEAQYRFYSRVKVLEHGLSLIWYFSCNIDNKKRDSTPNITGDTSGDDTEDDVDEQRILNSRLLMTSSILEMLHTRINKLEYCLSSKIKKSIE